MPGFSYVFIERPRRRCFCPVCRLPMREPVQIKSCGHRFCDLCLQELLSAGSFKCPEDDRPLDYAKLYPDKEVEGEIMASLIRCPNAKDGCRWVDRLQTVQSHLDTCLHQSVLCPNRCTAHLFRLNLDDHVEYLCPKRRVVCDFCSQQFNGDFMDQTHAGSCPKEVVWCENKCGAKLERRFLANHMKNECHKRTVVCQYCSRHFVHETLQTHQYQCPRYPVSCPNRCDPAKMPREQVDQHVQELCPSALIPCPFKDAGCKFKCARYNMDRHLDESLKTHLHLAWDLVRRQQQHLSHLSSSLHLTTPHITDGTFVWRLSSYKAKYIQAVYGSKGCSRELTSRPFYTSRFGYKAAMSVFLNGNGSGEGKYVSVYIKLLPGEYDNILEWPFRLPVSFTLYDQHGDRDMRANLVESFIPDPAWKHFQKPEKDTESLGFGYPKFVSHNVLKTRNYIKDDSLMIKVTVDTKRFILT